MKAVEFSGGPFAGRHSAVGEEPFVCLPPTLGTCPDSRFVAFQEDPSSPAGVLYLYRRVGVQHGIAFYRYVARVLRWRPQDAHEGVFNRRPA